MLNSLLTTATAASPLSNILGAFRVILGHLRAVAGPSWAAGSHMVEVRRDLVPRRPWRRNVWKKHIFLIIIRAPKGQPSVVTK